MASIFGNHLNMYKKIIFVLVIGLLIGQKSIAQQEKRCNTIEFQEYQKSTIADYEALMRQSDFYLQNYIKKNKDNNFRVVIKIPVVVHLLYHADSQNHQLSDWQITSQIDALNEDYRRFNADKFKTPKIFDSLGADCEIEFCLAKQDPDGNATNGIERTETTNSVFVDFSSPKITSLGGSDPWPHTEYLNIWVCCLQFPLLGFATFPSNSMGNDDGVVIHYKAFGRINAFSKKYYQGRTATHEIGHWLNLKHIWGDSPECSPDDDVDDTPLQAEEHYICDDFPFPSCNNTSDMFQNYMDYTLDSCMNIFTFGQKQRMLASMNLFRSSILVSGACNPVSTHDYDIGVIKILHPDDFVYGETMKPVITIHNYGTQTITATDIYYTKNWKSNVHVFNWTGSLAPNENIDVTLPEIADSSWYNVFCAWTKNPNDNQDADTTNDFKTRSYIVSFTYPPIDDLVIYPNPTGSLVVIDFREVIELKGTVAIYNVLGQMEQVNMEQLSLSKFQLDLSNFPSAIYFIELSVNGKKLVKKVVVQHEF